MITFGHNTEMPIGDRTRCRKIFCRTDIFTTDTLSNEHFVEQTV